MTFWTINKLIVLALISAFAVLMLEIRFEHQMVLGEHTIAWTPIVYSGLMAVLSLATLFFWERGGRQILFWAFVVALIVGVLGFWQHNEEHFGQRIAGVFTVWGNSTAEHKSDEKKDIENSANENKEKHKDEKASLLPPVFAPLTFAGLGILGMLACARRFQHELISNE